MGRIKRTRIEIDGDIQTQTKVCCVCIIRKDFSEFYNFKNKSDGKGYRCKVCDDLAQAGWRKRNPQRAARSGRNNQLKWKYGISIEEYEEKLKEQNEVCAICFQQETKILGNTKHSYSVDHNHETGQVRGLLCSSCNRGLGLLKDNKETLQSAISYLNKHETH